MRALFASIWLVVLTVSALLPVSALAQETVKWADIDCAQSKIQGPTGLRCRATQEYSGGTISEAKINTKGIGAGGTFRHWNKVGSINGVKFFYFLKEATSIGSLILSTRFELTVKEMIYYGQGATDFSAPSPIAGGDFLRFVDHDGENCMATRKIGAVAGNAGNRWYLIATQCVRKGRTIPDTDAAALLASADAPTAGY
jgi:hypothetical protein